MLKHVNLEDWILGLSFWWNCCRNGVQLLPPLLFPNYGGNCSSRSLQLFERWISLAVLPIFSLLESPHFQKKKKKNNKKLKDLLNLYPRYIFQNEVVTRSTSLWLTGKGDPKGHRSWWRCWGTGGTDKVRAPGGSWPRRNLPGNKAPRVTVILWNWLAKVRYNKSVTIS